jgi:ankyrin repeat protein
VTAGCVVRDGRTALVLAAVAGHSPVVALLIDAGADLNVQSNNG